MCSYPGVIVKYEITESIHFLSRWYVAKTTSMKDPH